MATEVVMPALGLTVEKGTIVKWLKKEGEMIKKGESLFEVEADKVATEVESPATGILAKILVPVGVEVPLLTVVGIITEAGEELPETYKAAPMEVPPAEEEAVIRVDGVSSSISPQPVPSAPGEPLKAVPAARKLAKDQGVELETVAGTGPEGAILVRDIEAALKSGAEIPAKITPLARKVAETEGIPLGAIEGTGARGRIMRADVERAIEKAAAPGLGKLIPMNTMRRVIARRMSESAFTAPHIYFFTDVWMEPLLDFRKDLLPDFEKKFEVKPSINDFLIKAVALNILDFPILNATIRGDEIYVSSEVNIGLAVALSDGLIVPAVTGADQAGLVEIVQQRKDLVQRALNGNLSLDELERGTFTISSLARYDITAFTAILNPPQSGILSIGKTRDELTLVDGEVKAKKVATFGLSVDHRIIDGVVAADFLQNLKWKLERPSFTFLSL